MDSLPTAEQLLAETHTKTISSLTSYRCDDRFMVFLRYHSDGFQKQGALLRYDLIYFRFCDELSDLKAFMYFYYI